MAGGALLAYVKTLHRSKRRALAAGWALHPIWDAGLHLQGSGATHAPEWYVVACISFDLLIASFIQWNRNDL